MAIADGRDSTSVWTSSRGAAGKLGRERSQPGEKRTFEFLSVVCRISATTATAPFAFFAGVFSARPAPRRSRSLWYICAERPEMAEVLHENACRTRDQDG